MLNWVKQSAIFTSLRPGSALGKKGEKKSASAKKKMGERSEPRGSLEYSRSGEGKGCRSLETCP